MRRAALPFWICLAALVACGGPARQTTAPNLAIQLAPEGLDVLGSGREIGFGRTLTSAVVAVEKLVERPPDDRAVVRGCGAGSVEAAHWDDVVTLYGVDGTFSGWATGSEQFRTQEGLSVGDGPDALAVIPGLTRLGSDAVQLRGITGTLDAQGRVSRLHAGRACD